jgi:hypothetical protein
MADRKLNSHPTRKHEFEIPADAPHKKALKVTLDKPERADTHEVWQKELRTGLPTTWFDPEEKKEKTITWLNNYGVKDKKTGKFADTLDFFYEVEFEIPAGSKAVYHDGKEVKLFPEAVYDNGKVRVKLDRGDPDTGRTP